MRNTVHKAILLVSGCVALVLLWSFYNYGTLRHIHKMVHLGDLKTSIFKFQSAERSISEMDSYISEHHKIGKYKLCKEINKTNSLPTIYFITPTYGRLEQKADLTQLSQTLLHIRNLHWIVVEDSRRKTHLVANLLLNCGVTFTHLNVRTPRMFQLRPGEPHSLKPRGAVQRNAGLTWIRTNLDPAKDKGIVYFADDDNTYSLALFDEVVGWHNYYKLTRMFPIDMAAFAISLKVIFNNPDVVFKNTLQIGMLETQILEDLGITLDDLEPRANNCTKVLVWHTRTETPSIENEHFMLRDYGRQSDRNIEV